MNDRLNEDLPKSNFTNGLGFLASLANQNIQHSPAVIAVMLSFFIFLDGFYGYFIGSTNLCFLCAFMLWK
jgi:hypothetical protein